MAKPKSGEAPKPLEAVFVVMAGHLPALWRGAVLVLKADRGEAIWHCQPDGIRDGHVPMAALQDVVHSITAHHRADGEYWVWIEDDGYTGYTKNLLYRWSPGTE